MSMSSCSMAFLKTMRPMRPKPLIPTLTGMIAEGVLVDDEVFVIVSVTENSEQLPQASIAVRRQ